MNTVLERYSVTGIIQQKIDKDRQADLLGGALSTLEQMINEDTEIVTILAGDEGTVEQANEFAEKLTEKHPDLEIEIHQGDQPVYPYLFLVIGSSKERIYFFLPPLTKKGLGQ